MLHSWNQLPENLPSDLDLAVHPADEGKLISALFALQNDGYTLVQAINYFPSAWCLCFVWRKWPGIERVAVDVIFRCQRGTLREPTSEQLLAGRRRHGTFWIASSESEFSYLLAKKLLKGRAPVAQVQRLRALVGELGPRRSEALASRLVPRSAGRQVVEACMSSEIEAMIARLKPGLWRTAFARAPLTFILARTRNALRQFRRWLNPDGAFIVIMGPDGAGKSTLIANLTHAVAPAFQQQRVYHWRPAVIGFRRTATDPTTPHASPPDGLLYSVSRPFVHVADYWLGYWIVTRPLLARCGLVIFDRYFDDVIVDPLRYRYGGPAWLARFMRHLVPRPDLTLFLDASQDAILARKQELPAEELDRQRRCYRQSAKELPRTRVIDAGKSRAEVTAEAVHVITAMLAARLSSQHSRWAAPSPPCQEAFHPAPPDEGGHGVA